MRKIAVFARGLMMSVCVLLTMTACSEEELVAPEENGGAGNNTTITTPTDIPMKTIRISAGMAQGEDGEMTRTTLNGQKVVWDEGDEYMIINQVPADQSSKIIKITLDGPKQGIGVRIPGALVSSEVNIKYDDLRVVVDGKDVTNDIMSTSTDNNTFMLGITNSDENYQYTKKGEPMKAKLYASFFSTILQGGDKVFLLARSSESDTSLKLSKDKKAEITITGLKYQFNINNNTWVDVDANSAVVQGSNISNVNLDNVAGFEWLYSINNPVRLCSEAGKSYGEFIGTIHGKAEIDEETIAVYPTEACKAYKGGNITIAVPETQTYAENGFDHKANIMVGNLDLTNAEKDIYDAKFKNMMGVFALTLTGDNDFVSEITLTDKGGKQLWGTATIPASNLDNGISTENIENGSSSIKMICEDHVELTSEEKTFYFVVPVGAFVNGFDVTVTTADGRVMTKSTSQDNKITRSNVLRMPTLPATFDIKEFDIENEVLKEYLGKGTYSSWGADSHFETRQVILFVPVYYTNNLGTRAVDKDYPNYYAIKWNGSEDKTYNVTFTDITANKTFKYTTNVPTYEFMNMVPGHDYKYTVKDGNKNITGGKFTATGRVRMITVEDTWNFRDMGGWTSTLGGTVQYEWLYRSGSLNGKWKKDTQEYSMTEVGNKDNYDIMSSTSQQQLKELGIKAELDLRAVTSEVNASSTDYSHSLSIDMNHTGLTDWEFKRIMFNNARNTPKTYYAAVQCVAWIIDEVVNHNRPVVFHCKSGADRTGNVAYLIHSLLGVSEGDLAVDFELTNFSHEQKIVTGKSEIRGKFTRDNTTGFFDQRTTATRTNPGSIMTMGQGNRQKNAYYYLNQYFKNDNMTIDSRDLDAFIAKMLGMSSYTQPGGVQTGNTLQSIYTTPQTNKVQ